MNGGGRGHCSNGTKDNRQGAEATEGVNLGGIEGDTVASSFESITGLKSGMVGAIANILSQAHASSQGRKDEATCLELFFKVLQAMGKGSDRFIWEVLEGEPVIQEVVPEPAGRGRVVHGLDMGPQFDAKIIVEEIVPWAAKDLMVNIVATADITLIKEASKVSFEAATLLDVVVVCQRMLRELGLQQAALRTSKMKIRSQLGNLLLSLGRWRSSDLEADSMRRQQLRCHLSSTWEEGGETEEITEGLGSGHPFWEKGGSQVRGGLADWDADIN
jgi:hypothetical protein